MSQKTKKGTMRGNRKKGTGPAPRLNGKVQGRAYIRKLEVKVGNKTMKLSEYIKQKASQLPKMYDKQTNGLMNHSANMMLFYRSNGLEGVNEYLRICNDVTHEGVEQMLMIDAAKRIEAERGNTEEAGRGPVRDGAQETEGDKVEGEGR